MQKKILHYFIQGASDGGSDHSLYTHLTNLNTNYYDCLIVYKTSSPIVKKIAEIGFRTVYLPSNNILIPNLKSNKSSKSIVTKRESKIKKYLRTLKLLINSLPEALKLRKIIIQNDIDLLHLNHNLNVDRAGIIAAILTGKKIISHNRGLHIPIQVDVLLSKYVDKIICISDYVKDQYINSGIKNKQCITVHNGVDTEAFNSSSNQNTEIIIGCIGRLEEWKGQQVLIRAIPSILEVLPNVKIQFIGSGSNKKQLVKLVKELNIQNSVEFLGSIANISEVIEKFTIAVHTSIEPEPFGRVIIEAMSMSKPVISTNIGGPKEIITNAVDGYLIEPNNPKLLSEKILELITNRKLISKISECARKKVIDSFDSKTTSNKIENVYKELLF